MNEYLFLFYSQRALLIVFEQMMMIMMATITMHYRAIYRKASSSKKVKISNFATENTGI